MDGALSILQNFGIYPCNKDRNDPKEKRYLRAVSGYASVEEFIRNRAG